jgi:hypothetical protein
MSVARSVELIVAKGVPAFTKSPSFTSIDSKRPATGGCICRRFLGVTIPVAVVVWLRSLCVGVTVTSFSDEEFFFSSKKDPSAKRTIATAAMMMFLFFIF